MTVRPARTAAQSRVIDTILDRLDRWAERTALLSRVTKATVTSVAAGGASDGNALVVINWQGVDIAAPYVSTYTPTVNHVVAVAKTGSQLLILGRIVGTP